MAPRLWTTAARTPAVNSRAAVDKDEQAHRWRNLTRQVDWLSAQSRAGARRLLIDRSALNG